MYSTDAMEYGVFSMDFPVPEDFEWVLPTRCGYGALSAAAPVSGGKEGLLAYILKGEGAAARAGEQCNYFSGCVIAVERAEELTLYPEEETEYLYLLLKNADGLLARIAHGCFVQEAADCRADRLLGRICYNASVHLQDSAYAASADAYGLLMELCAHCSGSRAEYSVLIKQAIEAMREEYAFLTGVDELAERLNVSKSHLIRTFTAAVGVSPGRYLQTVKLDNAKLMLQNRDYNIEMVADMAGYAGANYFCKVFRRATGETPGEYRARHLAPPALDSESRRRLDEMERRFHL